METATKCMMCYISLECSLTRNARDLCEGPYKNSFDHIELLRLNLRSRPKRFYQEKKFKLANII